MLYLSAITNDLVEEILKEEETNKDLLKLRENIINGKEMNEEFNIKNNFILRKGRYVLHFDSSLVLKIFYEYHGSPIGGHYGIKRTMKRIKLLF